MYYIVDSETGEIYDCYKTIDEVSNWIDSNCEVSEVYNWFGDIESEYYYNGNLITVVMN